jgi:hypothetical protein
VDRLHPDLPGVECQKGKHGRTWLLRVLLLCVPQNQTHLVTMIVLAQQPHTSGSSQPVPLDGTTMPCHA